MRALEALQLLRLRSFYLETIAEASDEIKKIDDILNEVQK